MISRGSRLSSLLGISTLLLMTLGGPAPGSAQRGAAQREAAQTGDALVVHGPDGSSLSLPVERSRGYATVSHEALLQLGWAIEVDPLGLRAQLGPGGPLVEFSLGSPLFRWDDDVLQMVSAPFSRGAFIQIPLQFVVDFLPSRASEVYAFSPDEEVLEILDASLWRGRGTEIRQVASPRGGITTRSGLADPNDAGRDEPFGQEVNEAQDLQKRVVVIDPGHGGSDPGTTGSGGRREKDIALAIGRYVVRELSGDEDIEVYMIRDRDLLVPLWERGPQATQWKGARPGVFISIHVNSSPDSPAVRGFETYFLSEARTEHELRVEAIENAPLQREPESNSNDVETLDLTFIERDLEKFNHGHWSSMLAEGIQRELEDGHPGPNRGVKQANLAVLTNVLMPAVLVEVGFISNRAEERILSQGEFQREIAVALAQGVRRFFDRYAPEQGVAVQDLTR